MLDAIEDKRIRLVKTAYVTYFHVDFAKERKFLLDFGFEIAKETDEIIYFKGYGTEPYCYVAQKCRSGQTEFGGAAYVVEDRKELERAARLPGATSIRKLDAPGGGEIVSLRDPEGHQVHLVYGQTEEPSLVQPPIPLEKLVVNYEDEKPRLGKFQRFAPGPAPVHRWGHYGVTYSEGQYQTMFDWYTQNLTLTPSDIVYKDKTPVTCFFHIDHKERYTDHHSFFFKRAPPGKKCSVAHAAFEVHDFDTQQLGHDYLTAQGYELCWGVGRHVLGSQVFDYWFDPSKFILEHYADGDRVNKDTPVAHVQAGPEALAVWGPPVPEVF
ncbi:Glyoxalase/Bleomycin resistance protein/Dihydroxybiphenyl dioxygenase [Hyaloscypha variabilis F]|uniref:Glyoxalase/Bleomycin resistance protein/Dihydroxybiphenyl dioxygenase n=1 Tax=Hyaloscypha variabilis (strain UAMH 11265 / GT02V1 / F) TaxID=1149755 RepID=A0A2J6QRM8_HYAVF|nr:Glyoxalase/Bleomycin resistance protein/Dihydroxybiphenyl dioxygenase [Hyaloscypha variabilis F]